MTDHGVMVSWQNAPANASSFNVYRNGGTTPLNSKPIPGETWLDKTALAGTSYTYTVGVVSISDAKAKASVRPALTAPQGVASAKAGESLGSAGVSVPATFSAVRGTNAAQNDSDLPTAVPTWPSVLGNLTTVHAAKATKPAAAPATSLPAAACDLADSIATLPSSLTTLSPTASCPGTFEITGDLTIPSGGTLSIPAGTDVFVDPGSAIIVNGVLNVDGNPASPVVFTSSNDPLGTEAPGDWGPIVFNVAPDQPQSTLTDMELSFGEGIVSAPAEGQTATVPPVITGGSITDISGVSRKIVADVSSTLGPVFLGFNPGVLFAEPSSAVSISGLTYNGSTADGDGGILALGLGEPLTLNVSNSSLTAGEPLAASSLGGEGAPDAGVSANITNNNLTATGDLPDLGLVSLGGSASLGISATAGISTAGTPGTSMLTGTISGNSLNGSPTSGSPTGAMTLVSVAGDSSAPTVGQPAAPTCASGFYAACDDLALSGNTLTTDGLGVEELTAVTNGAGNAVNSNAVTGGSYLTSDRSSWVSVAWALGSEGGDASNLSQYSGVTLTGGRASSAGPVPLWATPPAIPRSPTRRSPPASARVAWPKRLTMPPSARTHLEAARIPRATAPASPT